MIHDIRDRTSLIALGLGLLAWTAAGCAEGESAENEEMPDAEAAEEMAMAAPEPDAFATADADEDAYLEVDEISLWFDEAGILERWDVDRDSLVSRQEVLAHSFGLWDRDGDHALTEVEWQRGVDQWFPGDAEPIVFADWDDDGDSELDADEFNESFDVSVLGELWIEDLDRAVFKNAYFELYDLNDDGRVSRLEWDAALEFHGVPGS